MIRLPRDMSRDDISQWLNGGVFLVRTRLTATPVPVLWAGLDGVTVRGVDLLTSRLIEAPYTSCYAVWPELGSFNHPSGYAVYMSRIVERQYRRTFNSRCVRTILPWGYHVAAHRREPADALISWSVVCGLPFTNKYPADIDAAEQMLHAGALSVAVNRRLIIAGSPTSEKRMLYLDGVLAGTVVGGELHPTCGEEGQKALYKLVGGRYRINANYL